MPIAPPVPTSAGRRRNAVGWDALVAFALGAALLAGGWLDVRTYLLARGKSRPAFALMSTATAGQRIQWHEFFGESASLVHLGNIGLRNPFDDQTITVAFNGQPLEEIHLNAHAEITRQYPLELRPGANEFTLSFTRYHQPAPGERPIAARLLALDLYLPASDGSF